MRLLEGSFTLYTRFTSLSVRVSKIRAKLVCLSTTSKQAKCQVWSGTGRSRPEWSGITPEWMGFDNKSGTTLASAHVLCLDLLSCVWLHISGG